MLKKGGNKSGSISNINVASLNDLNDDEATVIFNPTPNEIYQKQKELAAEANPPKKRHESLYSRH